MNARPHYPGLCNGSILLYVLWILTVISALAFHATNVSRASVIGKNSHIDQIKTQLQIQSAINLAASKIRSEAWQQEEFTLQLNGANVNISIFNESGFLSLYKTDNSSLKRRLHNSAVSDEAIQAMRRLFDENVRFNDLFELRQLSGFSDDMVHQLLPYVSIYHEEAINPMLSPAHVLRELDGVDRLRVSKLVDSSNKEDRARLRREISEILMARDGETSDGHSNYFRIQITLGAELHRVFVRRDPREQSFRVLATISARANTNTDSGVRNVYKQ
jgi:type II secretory pathway component PulK